MNLRLRAPGADDIEPLARLVYEAFGTLHDRHRFPRDFPGIEPARMLMGAWVNNPRIFGVIAEDDHGTLIGCNFLDQRNSIPGVGPICVDPSKQAGGIGRKLMDSVMERARQTGASSVRLVQEPFNTVSLSLYTSLGFDVVEPLAVMQGQIAGAPSAGAAARPMTRADLPACNELCRRVHGFDRAGELAEAVDHFKPFVLDRGGRVAAYASSPAFWLMNHAVAEDSEDFKELLLGAGRALGQVSLLVPIRNGDLFRWCLGQRLRVIKPMTLMVHGDYQAPRGWWAPSVEY